MLYLYFIGKPLLWLIPWFLHSIGYAGILKKMDEDPKWAFLPVLGEWRMSRRLFKDIRSFFHPLIVTIIILGYRFYLSPVGTDIPSFVAPYVYLYGILAGIIYGLFLCRLYWRLAKAFGKNIPYRIFMVLVPLPFLLHLAYNKAQTYTQPVFVEKRVYTPFQKRLYNFIRTLGFGALCLALIAGLGFNTIRALPPSLMVSYYQKEFYNATKDLKGDNTQIITRQEAMRDDYQVLSSLPTSREKFYPNHDKAENVVVLDYVIGSNLEAQAGAASANILSAIDATKAGDNLTFVLETGGSTRWFTNGIKDNSVGRYTIKNGQLEKVQDLDETTCMSESESLADFLKWAEKEYPADRYMLILWDHGGGFTLGYGQDALNKPEDKEKNILTIKEITDALDQTNIKFDVIGFDACLMQTMEAATAFEPYTDYYLASEESENGFGWSYTPGFKMLAKDPTTPTEEFGTKMIAAYDQYNRALDDGKKNPMWTLSFVDLTLAKPAFEKMSTFYDKEKATIQDNPQDFSEIALAVDQAYAFDGEYQIDAINYLQKLDKADYDDSILTKEDKKDLINAIQASIVCRNKDAHKGVNGMALTFPYDDFQAYYTKTYEQYKSFDMKQAEDFYNDFFSIMAVQTQKESEKTDNDFIHSLRPNLTKEEWYQKGYENYAPQENVGNIELEQKDKLYSAKMDEKIWKIIIQQDQALYKKNGKNLVALGGNPVGQTDESGHMILNPDGQWFTISGQQVAYQNVSTNETKEGVVYKGQIHALLNDKTEILLNVEFDPIQEGDTQLTNGKITGYNLVDNRFDFMEKGGHNLEHGDKIQFMYDIYNEKGDLKETKAMGKKIRVRSQGRLKITTEPISGNYKYRLVFTDAFQRKFTTNFVDYKA